MKRTMMAACERNLWILDGSIELTTDELPAREFVDIPHVIGCQNWVEQRRVAYTLIGDVLRNADGSGSYGLKIHYRDGSCEVHTVVVAADGSARIFNQGGCVVGTYPAGTTIVPPQDVSQRIGMVEENRDTAEAWPY